ncbi:unnamed protein product, partial [Prorocentrum cordatum]
EERDGLRELARLQREELASLDSAAGAGGPEAEEEADAELARLRAEGLRLRRALEERRGRGRAPPSEWSVRQEPGLSDGQLRREVAAERARLAALEAQAAPQDAEAEGHMARLRAETEALHEELAVQRRLRREAEDGLRAALLRLGEARGAWPAAGAQAEAERARLADVQARLADEEQARGARAEALRGAVAELEAGQADLREAAADNERLRGALRHTLEALEAIRQRSGKALGAAGPARGWGAAPGAGPTPLVPRGY